MAITFAQLQELTKKEGYAIYISPDRPILQFRVAGPNGAYSVFISLQDEGTFLQFRTIDYLYCPVGYSSLAGILHALCSINGEKRFTKFAWDPANGEIVCYGDAWLMDNQLTQAQFNRMLANFLPAIDASYPRIKLALETGKDPGNLDPQALAVQQGSGGAAFPPELRELLEKLKKKDEGKPTGGHTTGEKPELKEI